MNSVRRSCILILWLTILPDLLQAQEASLCATQSLVTTATVPTQGQYRALVIYVRFFDDNSTSRDWPVSLTTPPSFAMTSSPLTPILLPTQGANFLKNRSHGTSTINLIPAIRSFCTDTLTPALSLPTAASSLTTIEHKAGLLKTVDLAF